MCMSDACTVTKKQDTDFVHSVVLHILVYNYLVVYLSMQFCTQYSMSLDMP